AAAVIQFAASLAVLAPLALAVEGFKFTWAWEMAAAIAFLVIFASILGVMVLYWLLRHGGAARVTSMMYLPPVFAVALELALFGVAPGWPAVPRCRFYFLPCRFSFFPARSSAWLSCACTSA